MRLDRADRRRLAFASTLTVVALPAVWLVNREDDRSSATRPNVAAVGLAADDADADRPDDAGAPPTSVDPMGDGDPLFVDERPAAPAPGPVSVAVGNRRRSRHDGARDLQPIGRRRRHLPVQRPARRDDRDGRQPRQRAVDRVRDEPERPRRGGPRAAPGSVHADRRSHHRTGARRDPQRVTRRRIGDALAPGGAGSADEPGPGAAPRARPELRRRPEHRPPHRPPRRASDPGDQVVEIGAGLGSLTLALAETGADVTAIEVDRGLVGALARGGRRARAGHGRRGRRDAPSTGRPCSATTTGWVLVANLPYNVATPLVADLLDGVPAIARMLVMVQREVAERLVAGAGQRRRTARSASRSPTGRTPASWARCRPTVFVPRPKVDSALVAITRPRQPPDVAAEPLFALVRAGVRPAAQDAAPLAARRRHAGAVRRRRRRADGPARGARRSRTGAG